MNPLEQYQQEQAQAYERTEDAEHAAAHLQVAMLAEIALQLRALNTNVEKVASNLEHFIVHTDEIPELESIATQLRDIRKCLTDGSLTMDQ